MKVKVLSLLLAASMLMVGCGSTTETASTEVTEAAKATEVAEQTATETDVTSEETETSEATTKTGRTVVDHAGNEVVLPERIDRIVISGLLPLPSVYCLFEGNADKLVGMPPSAMAAAENSILAEFMPDILKVSTDFSKNNELNIEELLELKPDVVFYSATNTAEYEKLKTTGIPLVGFSTSNWDFNCIETFEGWVTLLGEVLNQENKAQEIVDYGKSVEKEVVEKIEKAGDIEKPRVMILFNYYNGVMKVAGSNFFSQYWIETTGGINVAAELDGTVEVNMEQVYEWNPDIIYITNFTPYLPEDLYTNAIQGDDWSTVKAVQDQKVYKFPLGMYRWFPPASDTPLALKWLAQKNQPELFKDIDMEQEVKDYYKRFYNYDLTPEQVTQIFNPSPAAAGVS